MAYYAMGTMLNKCPCGGTPNVKHCRVAEDAYADFDTAEWLWQGGKAAVPPCGACGGTGIAYTHPDETEVGCPPGSSGIPCPACAVTDNGQVAEPK